MHPRKALRITAILREAIIGLASTPGKTAFGALSTCLGAAAAVAALGVSATSAAQVTAAFDAYAQTQVSLRPADAARGNPLDWEDIAALAHLDGAISATALGAMSVSATSVSLKPVDLTDVGIGVVATDPNIVVTLELDNWQGRPIDDGFHGRSDAVAAVGRVAADSLGLMPPYGLQAIAVDGIPVTVIGVFSASPRLPQLVEQVLVPRTWAESVGLQAEVNQIVVRTRVGAAESLARRVAVVVDPYQPELVAVAAPPTVENLRDRVVTEVDLLVSIMAGGAIVVGSLGIAHAVFLSVLRRQGEFALRQALGTTSVDLALLVVIEGSLLGLLAGSVGAVIGVVAVVATAAVQSWTPLLDVRWIWGSGALAMGLGATMSLYPALRIARVEPAVGLRHLSAG